MGFSPHKCPYIRACPYKYGRLSHTGPVLVLENSEFWTPLFTTFRSLTKPGHFFMNFDQIINKINKMSNSQLFSFCYVVWYSVRIPNYLQYFHEDSTLWRMLMSGPYLALRLHCYGEKKQEFFWTKSGLFLDHVQACFPEILELDFQWAKTK